MVPEYLCELVSIRKSSRKLRLSGHILLQVPVSRLKSYGYGVFSAAVPTLYNILPAEMRRLLKILNLF